MVEKDVPKTGKIVAALDAKGGSGGTTVALGLGAYLGSTGRKVLVVDFDFSRGALAFFTGYIQPTMEDILSAETFVSENLDEGIIKSSSLGVDLLLAPRYEETEALSVDFLKKLLEALAADYDYVILDASSGCPSEVLEEVVEPMADVVLLVVDYSVSGALAMGRRVAEIKHKATHGDRDFLNKFGIVLNKTYPNATLAKDALIRSAQGIPIVAAIPNNIEVVVEAANKQQLGTILENEELAERFRAIAEALPGPSEKA